MKNPQLVPMPPGLEDWLGSELESRGIDSTAIYSRYLISLLHKQHNKFDLSVEDLFSGRKGGGGLDTEEIKRTAQCLMLASEEKCGIEKLVDELCAKLKAIQGSSSSASPQGVGSEDMSETGSSSPEDQAERYYAAFPSLNTEEHPGASAMWGGENQPPPISSSTPPPRSKWGSNNKIRREGSSSDDTTTSDPMVTSAPGSDESEGYHGDLSSRESSEERVSSRSHVRLYERKGSNDVTVGNNLEVGLFRRDVSLQQLYAKFTDEVASIWKTPALPQPTVVISPPPPLSLTPSIWSSKHKSNKEFSDHTDSDIGTWPSAATPSEDIENNERIKMAVIADKLKSIWCHLEEKEQTVKDPLWSCTVQSLLNHSREDSNFIEVIPTKNKGIHGVVRNTSSARTDPIEEGENLLTSPRTHFRPIRHETSDSDSYEDGTTFVISGSDPVPVPFVRSESGNQFYLPQEDAKYMAFHKDINSNCTPTAKSISFVPKFLVMANEKFCQTDVLDMERDALMTMNDIGREVEERTFKHILKACQEQQALSSLDELPPPFYPLIDRSMDTYMDEQDNGRHNNHWLSSDGDFGGGNYGGGEYGGGSSLWELSWLRVLGGACCEGPRTASPSYWSWSDPDAPMKPDSESCNQLLREEISAESDQLLADIQLECSNDQGSVKDMEGNDYVMRGDEDFLLEEIFATLNSQNPPEFFLPQFPIGKACLSSDLEEEWQHSTHRRSRRSKGSKQGPPRGRPCSFFLEGNCRRADCKFSHDLASITCRFWEAGACLKGTQCPFLHGYNPAFYHDGSDSTGSSQRAGFELESERDFPLLPEANTESKKSSSKLSLEECMVLAPLTATRRKRFRSSKSFSKSEDENRSKYQESKDEE